MSEMLMLSTILVCMLMMRGFLTKGTPRTHDRHRERAMCLK